MLKGFVTGNLKDHWISVFSVPSECGVMSRLSGVKSLYPTYGPGFTIVYGLGLIFPDQLFIISHLSG